MAAYIIATIEVTDPEKFEVYRGQVPATIEKHGGRYLARGGDVTVVEGDQPVRRTVILEFDSLEKGQRLVLLRRLRRPQGTAHRLHHLQRDDRGGRLNPHGTGAKPA